LLTAILETGTSKYFLSDFYKLINPFQKYQWSILSKADGLLTFAYGKSIVQGPGSDDNLGGDDTFWVEAWKDLIALPSSLYNVPDSSVGKRLTQILTTELRNVRELRKLLKIYSFYTRSFI